MLSLSHTDHPKLAQKMWLMEIIQLLCDHHWPLPLHRDLTETNSMCVWVYWQYIWFCRLEGALLHVRYLWMVHFHPHDTASLSYIVTSTLCFVSCYLDWSTTGKNSPPSPTRKENGGHTVALTVRQTTLMLTSKYAFPAVMNTSACYFVVHLCLINTEMQTVCQIYMSETRAPVMAPRASVYIWYDKKRLFQTE